MANTSAVHDSDSKTNGHNSARWLAVLIVLFGFGLRWAAASNDLWLDEIWTWMTTLQLQSASDVLFRVHDENNHFLNTWFIYLAGPNATGLTYRLPAVFAGVISIMLAGAISLRRGSTAALFSMLLVASSYLLTHYSSEARGYGLVVCCALLAFWLLEKALEQPSFKTDFAFAAAAICGVLSQPMFVYAYGALGLWWLLYWLSRFQQTGAMRQFVISALRCHALPIAFMGCLYVINIRLMLNAGGPIESLADVIAQTLALAVGISVAGVVRWFAAAFAVGAAATALVWLKRNGGRRWLFFLLVMLVAPALLLLAVKRSEVYPRYFLISVAFWNVLLGQGLAELWDRRREFRLVAAVILLLIVSANLVNVARLIQLGRGNYRESIGWMLQQSGGDSLRVGSDHDFRNTMLLSFNQQFFTERIVYYPMNQWPPQGPDWFIQHRIEQGQNFESEYVASSTQRYQLQRVVRYAGLSGWDWAIYRRETPTTQHSHEQ